MKIWPKASHVDWLSYGREFHNKALPLLRELLDQLKMRDANNTILNQDGDELQQRKCLQESHELVPQIDLDDLLAAAAILCEYEFLDGSCINWSVHLTGTKSLLDEVHCRMMPLDPQCLNRTKARKAVFWNFARQDFVAAFINKTQTRLSTANIQAWREAGLLLSDTGKIPSQNSSESWYTLRNHEGVKDTHCNSLIHLSSKFINFINAGISLVPVSAEQAHSPNETTILDDSPVLGIPQKRLLQQRYALEREISAWNSNLPDTFQPCARIILRAENDDGTRAGIFSEIWYSIPTCASAMQNYPMARIILLLINKPYESTGHCSTVLERLASYRHIQEDIDFQCREIYGIALSRPDGVVRVHGAQALFVAGQCFEGEAERKVVKELLSGVERDLGWATGGW